MRIHLIDAGTFMLDGGAVFGTIPKSLWQKVYPGDENNLCNFALRSLLIEDGDRRILIDTGIGNKQSDKFYSYYYLNRNSTLEKSLAKRGFLRSDITDVVLTHLHFDHCGGAVCRDDSGNLAPSFPNARYWVSRAQWDWANKPNKRERASFLAENYSILQSMHLLNFIEDQLVWSNNICFRLFGGHTEGLVVPFIEYSGRKLVFTTDLFPTAAHIRPSWVCGFDTRPLLSMEEKEEFLKEALAANYLLIFQHDLIVEACSLKMGDKGPELGKELSIREVLSEDFKVATR